MALREIQLPHKSNFDFGVGVDRLSGSTMNFVVAGEPSPVMGAGGSIQSFNVSRVSSSSDLQQQLGIDIDASYGCASFGAGASARFKFIENTRVQSTSLFMTVTATVKLADLSIDHCVLTPEAGSVVDRPDVFNNRYGNMFCRACKRGGLFVGVLRVETNSQESVTKIESDLKGSYGAFSAEASLKFNEVFQKHGAQVYCTVYAEGGPPIQINDPTNPSEMLKHANDWMQALQADPNKYAVPYEWTLSPITIAEGPLPLNNEEILKAQDVLKLCARERTSKLDGLNQLSWMVNHANQLDWTDSVQALEIQNAVLAFQNDLNTIADCAIKATESPRDAVYPAVFAASRGGVYPSAVMPQKLPKPLPGVVEPAKPSTVSPGSNNGKIKDWKLRGQFEVRPDIIEQMIKRNK